MLDAMEHVSAAAVIDVHGTVTGWSDGARRLTGYPAELAVGLSVRDLLAEDPPPHVVADRAGVVVLRRRDGTRRAVRIRAVEVRGPGGEAGGFVLTARPAGEGGDPSLADRAFQQSSLAMAVVNPRQHCLRVNRAACRVLGVDESELLGRPLPVDVTRADHGRGFRWHLEEVARRGESLHYETYTRAPDGTRYHAWNIEMWPVRDGTEQTEGVAVAAFDSTEQHWARQRLALLNEAADAIGTTLDVVRTAEELVELVVPRFADFASVDLLDWVLGPEEPPMTVPSEVVLRRVAHASGRDGTPEAAVHLDALDVYPPYSPPVRALREGRAVLGRLGEAGFDRWVRERNIRSPEGSALREGAHSMLAAPLRARGVTLGVVVAVRIHADDGYAPDDAVLAEELASRAAVCIDNSRRFARERSTALALQHSLLPQVLPGQAAVEVAHRYLPSGSVAGIGGDWFDVIPLSGSRVGLVVGDVVGHGITSSATMGRLCTAVRTLADVDLPPDELLTHLDDLVSHLAAYDTDGDAAELGATCLYAVYDPVARRLALAAAGHPPAVLVPPGGPAAVIPMNVGPPLGVGGLPFEATEVDVPEGSVIALYTDGLIEDRDRDPDRASDELRGALGAGAGDLDDLCDAVLKAVLPETPSDDVALLLARTRALGDDRVATWDVTADPTQVATARQAVSDQLAAWGLEDAAFVTELVVSELVTNAIRYGAPPIQLRLIRDRSLICEVSDGSSTSPHLRRAHAFDEGGRGLLLVAQLTQRWGSRQNGTGKTIWAEQPLP
jgi:PAS domain S-box-containing protein